MVVALMCPCFNVTIYLEHAPTKQEGMLWLSEYYEISKGIGKATLAVAGVTMVCLIYLNLNNIIERGKNSKFKR